MNTPRVSYTIAEVAEATGYSVEQIRAVARGGQLVVTYPKGPKGKRMSKGVVLHADLMAWLDDERESA